MYCNSCKRAFMNETGLCPECETNKNVTEKKLQICDDCGDIVTGEFCASCGAAVSHRAKMNKANTMTNKEENFFEKFKKNHENNFLYAVLLAVSTCFLPIFVIDAYIDKFNISYFTVIKMIIQSFSEEIEGLSAASIFMEFSTPENTFFVFLFIALLAINVCVIGYLAYALIKKFPHQMYANQKKAYIITSLVLCAYPYIFIPYFENTNTGIGYFTWFVANVLMGFSMVKSKSNVTQKSMAITHKIKQKTKKAEEFGGWPYN